MNITIYITHKIIPVVALLSFCCLFCIIPNIMPTIAIIDGIAPNEILKINIKNIETNDKIPNTNEAIPILKYLLLYFYN